MKPQTGVTGKLQKFTATLRRFLLALLVLTAFGLMLLGKADNIIVGKLQVLAADVVAPVMETLARPAGAVMHIVDSVKELSRIRAENRELRAENREMKRWKHLGLKLVKENKKLQKLLNYTPPPAASYISARVIADAGGSFAHSLLINAGRAHGVRIGAAVLSGDGLVGRIVHVGQRVARILLLTDINSRLPVRIADTRMRAVLAGDNTEIARLAFLPDDAAVSPGDRIITSGHGGAFPPGLPVGVVTTVEDKTVRVRPALERHRLEFVRIVDYGLKGIISRDPLSATAEAP